MSIYDLKNCPRCGSDNVVNVITRETYIIHGIIESSCESYECKCRKCGLSTGRLNTNGLAYKSWNMLKLKE